MQDATPSNPPTLDYAHAGIEGLKKMSTTAGLGSGNYAAVNTLAVVAAVGIFAGLLSLLTNLLLVLPVIAALPALPRRAYPLLAIALGVAWNVAAAAVLGEPLPIAALCGVIAVRQIRQSNGTQTGLKLAVFAIVINLGIVGYVVGSQAYKTAQNKPDAEAIQGVLNDFSSRIASRDYAGAYQLGTPQFRSRVTEARFVGAMSAFEANADTGAVASIEWIGTPIDFQTDPQSASKMAWVGTLFKYRKNYPANRIPIGFVKVEGKWGVNDIPALFK